MVGRVDLRTTYPPAVDAGYLIAMALVQLLQSKLPYF